MELARHEFGRGLVVAVLVIITIVNCGIESSAAVQPGPVEAWLTRLRSAEPSVRVQAAYDPPATEEISTDQATILLTALGDKSSYVRRYVASALGELRTRPDGTVPALIKALSDRDAAVRQHAAVAIGKIGSPAIPLLIERLASHPDDDVTFALSRCGEDIIEPLLEAVRKQRVKRPRSEQKPSKHRPEFEDYAWALFSNVGKPALPALIRALNDEALASFVLKELYSMYPAGCVSNELDSDKNAVSAFARSAIESCMADARAYLQLATTNLTNTDPEIRKLALHMLVYLQRQLPVGTLVRALNDPDSGARSYAASYLQQVDRAYLTDVPIAPLITALKDPDELVQTVAAKTLGMLHSREAVPQLVSILGSPYHVRETVVDVRETVVEALGRIGSGDNDAIPALTDVLLHDREEYIREAAARALINVGGDTKVVKQELVQMMRASAGRGMGYSNSIAAIIAQVRPDGITWLIEILRDRREAGTMRAAASYALSQASNSDVRIDAALQFALDDPVREVRAYASRTLVQKGQAREALPVFVKSMDRFDYWRTNLGPGESLKTLIAVSPPDVASILSSGKLDRFELVWVIEAIGEYAEGNTALVVPLIAKLDDKEPDVRAAAAEALGHFPSAADRIKLKLVTVLSDSFVGVRINCARALEKLGINVDELGPLYGKVLNDYFIENGLSAFIDEVKWILYPERILAGDIGGVLPDFPWPPPQYSHIGEFGKDFPREALGTDQTTLAAIYNKLYWALQSVDTNFESSLFGAPGGFALLAKMERVEADGSPLPGKYRWVQGKVPPLTFADYLGRLFLENPGYFRIIAFVVTDKINFGQSGQKLPAISEGGTDLPPEIAALPFAGRNCYILVYSFERRPGAAATEIKNSELSAKTHLVKAGIWGVLTGSK